MATVCCMLCTWMLAAESHRDSPVAQRKLLRTQSRQELQKQPPGTATANVFAVTHGIWWAISTYGHVSFYNLQVFLISSEQNHSLKIFQSLESSHLHDSSIIFNQCVAQNYQQTKKWQFQLNINWMPAAPSPGSKKSRDMTCNQQVEMWSKILHAETHIEWIWLVAPPCKISSMITLYSHPRSGWTSELNTNWKPNESRTKYKVGCTQHSTRAFGHNAAEDSVPLAEGKPMAEIENDLLSLT